MDKNIRIQTAIVMYLVFIGAVIYFKPKHIYKEDGTLKQFGSGNDNTLFPLWFMIFLGAFMSYYITHVVLFIKDKKM
jgi:hypothetical protein